MPRKSSHKRTEGAGWRLVSDAPTRSGGCPAEVSLPPDRQRITLRVEKRRKGKVVTVIAGLMLADADLKALARELKAGCGTGGTAGDGEIELQGDCRDRAGAWLRDHGWRLK